MPHSRFPASLIIFAVLLSGCGSNSDDDKDGGTGTAAPVRGSLVQNPPSKLATYSPTELLATLGGGDLGQLLLQLAFNPKCTIDVHQLQYNTVGAGGEPTTASGALMVPSGSDPACQGGRPIVLYAHGTSPDRNYNIANLNGSNNSEALLLAAVFAAQGYIVVAPNYAGYDSSTLAYHPYLNADQQSKDMIDALAAARSALPTSAAPATTDGGKLFITGYSQGGYVAMATQRALQASGQTVTASGPMSGPYALAAFSDAVFYGQVSLSAPLSFTLLVSGYQHAYGNIYSAPTDIFEAKYASGIGSLLPSTDSGNLSAQGKLPSDQLFSSTPPDPAYASITPPTTPANLAPVFAAGFGADNLIINSYRLAYLQDAAAHPDGGFPTTTDGLPAAAPANAFRQALKLNDLRNWTPTAPTLLCAGSEDPTVFYLNTQLMQGYWAANTPTAPVTIVDIDSSPTGGDPYGDLKNGFEAAKQLAAATAVVQGASDGGAADVAKNYHAGLVAPFCLAAVDAFFKGF